MGAWKYCAKSELHPLSAHKGAEKPNPEGRGPPSASDMPRGALSGGATWDCPTPRYPMTLHVTGREQNLPIV
jgi:hypothetical protein